MVTEVGEAHDLTEPVVRRKHVSARNYAGRYPEVESGECGRLLCLGPATWPVA